MDKIRLRKRCSSKVDRDTQLVLGLVFWGIVLGTFIFNRYITLHPEQLDIFYLSYFASWNSQTILIKMMDSFLIFSVVGMMIMLHNLGSFVLCLVTLLESLQYGISISYLLSFIGMKKGLIFIFAVLYLPFLFYLQAIIMLMHHFRKNHLGGPSKLHKWKDALRNDFFRGIPVFLVLLISCFLKGIGYELFYKILQIFP